MARVKQISSKSRNGTGDKQKVEVASKQIAKPKPVKRRHKPLAVATKEIKRYQMTSSNLCQKEPFYRLIRDIAQKECVPEGIRWTKKALVILQKCSEHFLTTLLQDANAHCEYSGRITLAHKDIWMTLLTNQKYENICVDFFNKKIAEPE